MVLADLSHESQKRLRLLVKDFSTLHDRFLRLSRTIEKSRSESPDFYERRRREILGLCQDVDAWFEQVARVLVVGHWVSNLSKARSWLYFYGGRIGPAGTGEAIDRLRQRYGWMNSKDVNRYSLIQDVMDKHEELGIRLGNIDSQDFNVPTVADENESESKVLEKIDSTKIMEQLRGLDASVKTAEKLKEKIEALYQEASEAREKTQQSIESTQKQSMTLLTNAMEAAKGTQDKRESADKVFQDLKKQGTEKLQELATFAETGKAKIDTAVNQCKAQYEVHLKELGQLKDIALAQGLCAIYLEKEKQEAKRYCQYSTAFYVALGVLALILMSPVLLLCLHFQHVPTEFWKLLVFYPLEVPTIWLLFLFSKRAKIAYRLAEDYTHKRMVGLVYQGLRAKVKELGESNAEDAKRLQALLLQAVITTTATNSGDLIKGFNNPDCPITDVLKSVEVAGSKFKLSTDQES